MRQLVTVGALVTLFVAFGLTTPGTRAVAGQQLPATVDVPSGAEALGTISLPRGVMANGQALSAGDYEVRLTAESATPATVGALTVLERWVEFRQGDDVRGREVVTIVPSAEIGDVAKSAAPGSGASRVEMLRENDYMRVWINQSGTHYLIHLAVG